MSVNTTQQSGVRPAPDFVLLDATTFKCTFAVNARYQNPHYSVVLIIYSAAQTIPIWPPRRRVKKKLLLSTLAPLSQPTEEQLHTIR